MNILVTGGAGFIGFHVSKSLLERGDTVINIDSFNDVYDPQVKQDRHRQLLKFSKYKSYTIDISNYQQLKTTFETEKINKICHLAARAGVLPSLIDPHPYILTNIQGTLNLFQLAKEFHISHIVAASSSSVYGTNQKMPSSEDDPVDTPISLYAATKKSTELMAHCYVYLFGLNITMLRFFNVYGEWGRPDMMPWIFTERIIQGETIKVNNYGDTWKDYTYISDITAGVIAAIDKPLKYEVINLGNHTPVHLKHCIEIIETLVGKKAILDLQPPQPGDVAKSCADISKARRLLGWEPKVKMEQGLANFVAWYLQYTHQRDEEKSGIA